ncbi:uncharacterized protein LOC141691911 [Apium graveolens]|uniref:uncharacterized protein LOC141691911 n=1 Tax=Apium graveolens TaxID=4045 RepID=UPI003D7A46B3
MKTLSWNCHGHGTPWAFQFLTEIVIQKHPDFLLLSEILCKRNTVEKLQNRIGFEGMVIVETQGHSGGIDFLFRNNDVVNLNSYSKNHIDLTNHNKQCQLYRVTGVYSEPDRRKRSEIWNLLRTLAMYNNLPWCLIRDFNNVVSQNDKKGGRPYPHNLVQGFRDVLEECQLIDMDLQGHRYMWERGVGTSQWIEVRLDRALVNVSFQAMFEVAKLINLEISTSDHCPILLALQDKNYIARTQRFKFENAWLHETMCQQIVAEVWAEHEHLSLFDKLKECLNILSAWGQEITGNFKQRIKSCKRILKTLKGRRDDNSVELIKHEQRKLSEIYTQHEVFWRQHSKQLWLREGDSNIKFFHASVKKRRAINKITSLKDRDGGLVDWNSGLENMVINYFDDLFTASQTK